MNFRFTGTVFLLFVLSPLVLLIFFWNYYAVNIPYWDDLHLLDGFIIPFKQSTTFNQRVALLLEETNGHKVVYPRLISFLLLKVTGEIDLKEIMLVGLFHVFGIFLVLFRVFSSLRISILYFIPVSFILFNPITDENIFFAFASIQNYSIHLLIILSIFVICFQSSSGQFWISFSVAICLALISSLSSGTGLSVFFGGGYALLLMRAYRRLGIWCICALTSYLFYTNFYHGWSHIQWPSFSAIVKNSIYFIGSAFSTTFSSFQKSSNLAFFYGLTVILAFLAWSVSQFYLFLRKQKPLSSEKLGEQVRIVRIFCSSCVVYLIIIAVLAAITKSEQGPENLFSSRYSIHSLLIFSFFYLFLLTYRRWIKLVFIINMVTFALLLSKSYYKEIQYGYYHQQLRKADLSNWNRNGIWLSTSKEFQDVFPNSPQQAIAASIYHPPLLETLDNVVPTPAKWPIARNSLLIQQENKDYLSFYAPRLVLSPHQEAYFGIYTGTRWFLLPAVPEANSIRGFLTTGNYWQQGLRCLLPKRCISEGILTDRCHLFLLYIEGTKRRLMPFDTIFDPIAYQAGG